MTTYKPSEQKSVALAERLNALGYEIGIKELTEALAVEGHALMTGLLDEVRYLERENTKLTNKLNRMRNIFPGRNPITVIEWIIQDWTSMNQDATDEDGVPWVGKEEAAFLHRVDGWGQELIDRLWECREILRGPGKREKMMAEHKKAIDLLTSEGLGAGTQGG